MGNINIVEENKNQLILDVLDALENPAATSEIDLEKEAIMNDPALTEREKFVKLNELKARREDTGRADEPVIIAGSY